MVDEAWIARVKSSVPELPRARAERFVSALGLSPYDARVLNEDQDVARYFEDAVKSHTNNAKSVANWVINEVMRETKEHGVMGFVVTPQALGTMVGMIDGGRISGKIAKELFALMISEKRADPEALVKERGWEVVRDDAALEKAVDEVLAKHASEVEKLRAGKTQVMGFLVGQTIKALGGKVDPKLVNQMIQKKVEK